MLPDRRKLRLRDISDFALVTQLVSGRTGAWSQVCDSEAPSLPVFFMVPKIPATPVCGSRLSSGERRVTGAVRVLAGSQDRKWSRSQARISLWVGREPTAPRCREALWAGLSFKRRTGCCGQEPGQETETLRQREEAVGDWSRAGAEERL